LSEGQLRRVVLKELRDAERVMPGVILKTDDLADELKVSTQDVEDQLDILSDLGAIRLTRFFGDDGFRARLTGSGKLMLEEFDSESHAASQGQPTDEEGFRWDAFIAHASEDKEPFVRHLAVELSKECRIWYDDFTLRVGDRLRRKIDEGLAQSRYGIVVLSPNFFNKHWPQEELDGLVQREVNGRKVILPVWLDVGYPEVRGYSVTLADRMAARAEQGLAEVVRQLSEVIRPEASAEAAMGGGTPTSEGLRGSQSLLEEELRLVTRIHEYRFAGGARFPVVVLTVSVENAGNRHAFVDAFEAVAKTPFDSQATRYEFRDPRREGIERDLPMNIPARGVSEKIKVISHFDRGFGNEGSPFELQIAAVGPYEYQRVYSRLAGTVSPSSKAVF
jgi:TIR domain